MRFLLPLALAAGLTACATTEDVVPVSYTASAAQSVPGAENIHVSVTATDARTTNRGRISTKVNGYGMEMAAIRTNDDIAADVKNAIANELKARGYKLSDGGQQVSAAVTTFYTTFNTGMWAGRADGRVEMTVKVSDPSGRTLYSRDLHGLSQKTIQLASGKNAAAALSDALSEALKTLFTDGDFLKALAGQGAVGA